MDINQLNIQKVANGYIVREGFSQGVLARELAVFNDVNDMCEWIKRNFTLSAQNPQNPLIPEPNVKIGWANGTANIALQTNEAGVITGMGVRNGA